MNVPSDDGGSKDSVAVSVLKVSLWPVNDFSCLLPAVFLYTTSSCPLSILGLQNMILTSPLTLQTLQKIYLLTLSILISASPPFPPSTLGHLVTSSLSKGPAQPIHNSSLH